MGPTSALVLFAMIWFLVFLIVLQSGGRTQGEAGSVVPGTHSSAPEDPQMRRKLRITTIWTLVIWVVIAGIIMSGMITIRDLDWFNRMATPDLNRG